MIRENQLMKIFLPINKVSKKDLIEKIIIIISIIYKKQFLYKINK